MSKDRLHPDQLREQAEFRDRVARMDDIPTDELLQYFELNDLQDLAAYQQSLDTQTMLTQPYSEEFSSKYAGTAEILANNTSIYDEETEDTLMEDPVIQDLFELKRLDPKNKMVGSAIRSRRSVLVCIFTVDSREPCEVRRLTLPQELLTDVETDLPDDMTA